ncbi:MAG: UDP-N-acetylglucosamine 1-carboxyvinyltransferase [Patescibacteria group bacterium]|jgi:UDP-N-acetylglucosamine 1-carboxyvinyltransferase|nr:UDP-N-acetylglucosamine 1-carboxyvinyltransferase [Patescibacteria group bacterium]
MSRVVIKPSKKIQGKIVPLSSKNSALPILVAACLCKEEVILENFPTHSTDAKIMLDILIDAGFNIEVNETEIKILPTAKQEIKYKVSAKGCQIRYSILLMSLLIHKIGQFKIPLPGGCQIGERKHDISVDSLRTMGATISETNKYINGKSSRRLQGKKILFHTATTTGTENIILAASVAGGITEIRNANTRPEVIDLIKFLHHAGVTIKYKSKHVIIYGKKEFGGGRFTIPADNYDAASFAILAAICRTKITIASFDPRYIPEEIDVLKKIGVSFYQKGKDLVVDSRNRKLKPFFLVTSAYPGINSDMHPLFSALAVTIKGESIITETRFKDRFQYVKEFKKLGADIQHYMDSVVINGGTKLKGARVKATDVRAGIALLFLSLSAEKRIIIDDFQQIERCYQHIITRLSSLGADISKK